MPARGCVPHGHRLQDRTRLAHSAMLRRPLPKEHMHLIVTRGVWLIAALRGPACILVAVGMTP